MFSKYAFLSSIRMKVTGESINQGLWKQIHIEHQSVPVVRGDKEVEIWKETS